MKNRTLNVGCGNDTYGTDFVDLYPQRSEVIKCNVDEQKLPYPSSVFDEVYSGNLFEHLKNPFFVLKEMKRVLKKGGKLVLITDNAGYPFHHIGKNASHQDSNYRGKGESDRHFALYTKMHLKNYMTVLNMKNVKIYYKILRFPSFKSWLLVSFCSFIKRIKKFENVAFPLIVLEAKKK